MDHMWQDALTAIKNTFDIDIKHSVIIIFGNIREKLLLCDACIVDKRLHTAEMFQRFRHQKIRMRLLRDITFHRNSVTA
ncbi:hypothetical protein SDC9_186269 [bioreactor metagenome]|uniref:Uncharacterized protein n=1 Tax=bioreactor metagenome TaxID=1076179 RepID=A0A645HRH4_9ZZZZ